MKMSTKKLPKANRKLSSRINPNNIEQKENNRIVFSFQALNRNDYFNLDGTCTNWSSDLFETMKKVSEIEISEITAGKYTGKNSTLRIHTHSSAHPPCELPDNVTLDDLWQIRISKSKGGIHGRFVDNIFYVIWFDPLHNMYPNENYGGLRKVSPPSTCCKDRDNEISDLKIRLEKAEEEAKEWEEFAKSCME